MHNFNPYDRMCPLATTECVLLLTTECVLLQICLLLKRAKYLCTPSHQVQVPKKAYTSVKRALYSRQMSPIQCQKRRILASKEPSPLSKEAYTRVKRALYQCQQEAYTRVKRALYQCQQRPILASKGPYTSVKRGLYSRQKSPISVSKEAYTRVKRGLFSSAKYLCTPSASNRLRTALSLSRLLFFF